MALIRMESYGISIAPQLALIYHPTYITNTMLTLHLAVCVCVCMCLHAGSTAGCHSKDKRHHFTVGLHRIRYE